MSNYDEIILQLEKIKDNHKALAYINKFLKLFIERYC